MSILIYLQIKFPASAAASTAADIFPNPWEWRGGESNTVKIGNLKVGHWKTRQSNSFWSEYINTDIIMGSKYIIQFIFN